LIGGDFSPLLLFPLFFSFSFPFSLVFPCFLKLTVAVWLSGVHCFPPVFYSRACHAGFFPPPGCFPCFALVDVRFVVVRAVYCPFLFSLAFVSPFFFFPPVFGYLSSFFSPRVLNYLHRFVPGCLGEIFPPHQLFWEFYEYPPSLLLLMSFFLPWNGVDQYFRARPPP